MLKSIVNLLKILNSEAEPAQISLAFGFSMIAGFLPFFSLFNIIIFLTVFLLRVNLSAFFLGTAFFSGVAYLLDPVMNWIGFSVLTAAPLEGLWTAMYNSTLWRLQRFNNTVVMGSLVTALILFVPLALLCNMLIRRYREHILAWIKKTRIMQMIKGSDFYNLYQKVSGWRARI